MTESQRWISESAGVAPGPRRLRAPWTAYLKMVALGLLISAALAGAAASFTGQYPLLMFVVMFATTLPVGTSLGWVLFVSDHVAVADRHAEDNVEQRWIERASADAFLDSMATLGLAATAFAIVGDRLRLPVSAVLGTVIALMMLDVVVRYLRLRRRFGADGPDDGDA